MRRKNEFPVHTWTIEDRQHFKREMTRTGVSLRDLFAKAAEDDVETHGLNELNALSLVRGVTKRSEAAGYAWMKAAYAALATPAPPKGPATEEYVPIDRVFKGRIEVERRRTRVSPHRLVADAREAGQYVPKGVTMDVLTSWLDPVSPGAPRYAEKRHIDWLIELYRQRPAQRVRVKRGPSNKS